MMCLRKPWTCYTVSDVREITLDWDWPCKKFRPEDNRIIRQIKAHEKVKEIWWRCSANKHLHIKIVLNEDVDFWESIYLRSKWDDDANRIRMDIIRYWENMEYMRLWDEKLVCGKKCVLRKAGPWRKL
jgi:hypothetical protein